MLGFSARAPEHLDDRELLRRTCRGSDAAARALWSRHAPSLTAMAAGQFSGGADGAGELVQDVFCRLLELPLAQVDAIDEPGAYLARMVRNAGLNRVRAGERLAAHARAAAESRAGRSADAARRTGPDENQDLRRALERLDPEERELLVLKHAAGLTFDQLAGATSQNRSTAATRYRAALERLSGLLRADAGTTGGAA